MVRLSPDSNTFARRAAVLDEADPLARFREQFVLSPGQIYLDGNSLGLLSRRAQDSAIRVIAEWAALGIAGWTDADPPWAVLPEKIAARLAEILGASPNEILVAGQTTQNLHQLLSTLYDSLRTDRSVVVGLASNFPSDNQAITSHLRLRGQNPSSCLRLVQPNDDGLCGTAHIIAALSDDVQMAVLPSVIFTSGELLDVVALTKAANDRGVLIGWDLSHSIGAIPHVLGADDGPDFAFWCSYKWLNAGPGATGGLFLHSRHHHRNPGMEGWWGVRPDRRFAMALEHEPTPGAQGLHIGTPSILATAPLAGSLSVIEAAGIDRIREKSLMQTDLLIEMSDTVLTRFGVSIVSPREHVRRGAHVTLAHRDGLRLSAALKAVGVTPDFRPPNMIRLAPSPLYTSFSEIVEAIDRLHAILASGSHASLSESRPDIT